MTRTLPRVAAAAARALPARPDSARAADVVLTTQVGVSLRSVERRIDAALDAATEAEWEAGLRWYDAARDVVAELSHTYALHHATVAAVVAALSPQTRWSANVAAARAALRGWERPGGLLVTNWQRAADVLGANDGHARHDFQRVAAALGAGPKVAAFAANLRGDYAAVTIDVWAVRVALLGHATPRADYWRSDESAATARYLNGALGRKGVYGALAVAYARVAARRGLAPCDVQAVAWVVIRGAAE